MKNLVNTVLVSVLFIANVAAQTFKYDKKGLVNTIKVVTGII